jgi:hypothetical protein
MVNYRFNSLALDAVDFSKAANGAIKVWFNDVQTHGGNWETQGRMLVWKPENHELSKHSI